MSALHHVGYWVEDLDSAIKQWSRDLGVGPFNVIEHVPFDSFVLTADGQEHRDVVFDHSAAFAAWGPVVVELGQVHAIDASDVPWMKPELVGQHGIMSLVEWSGDPAEGQAVLGQIRNQLAPAASDLSVVPFLVMQTITDHLFGHGLRTYIKAGVADDLPDGLIDVLLDRAARIQSPISQVELLALGGAIAKTGQDATAFPFRRARWLINIPATWRAAADDEREIAWARATYAAVRPYLTEGNYVNFMGDDEDDTAAGAYGRTIGRLQRIKAAYDPDNVFRLNQNIRPAGLGIAD